MQYDCIFVFTEDSSDAFTKKLTDVKVKIGETAMFMCETKQEYVDVIWKKDGQVLKSDNRIDIIADKRVHKLIIHEATAQDRGIYSCTVRNISTTAKLIVEGKTSTATMITKVSQMTSCHLSYQSMSLEALM